MVAKMNKLTFLLADPEIQEGAPVFLGTHIRYETFCDYMRIGVTMREFLAEFPSISHDQATQALAICVENIPIDQVASLSLMKSELRSGSR
jgi:uncharacterized protein (DUF433 family)